MRDMPKSIMLPDLGTAFGFFMEVPFGRSGMSMINSDDALRNAMPSGSKPLGGAGREINSRRNKRPFAESADWFPEKTNDSRKTKLQGVSAKERDFSRKRS
jgi:hypothetical protein